MIKVRFNEAVPHLVPLLWDVQNEKSVALTSYDVENQSWEHSGHCRFTGGDAAIQVGQGQCSLVRN